MVTRQTASLVRDAVVEAIDPLEIILFGSVAAAASGNDLDLLVVTDDPDGAPESESARELTTVLRAFKRTFDIDDYLLTRSQFAEQLRRGSVFLRKIVSEGICIYMREGIKEWRQQSDEELKTAEYLLSGGFYRGACYHAQQCVERSIKTMLLKRGWDLEKIHSIHRLAAIAEDYRLQIPLQPAESGLLPLGTPTKADADRSVAVAKQSVRALHGLLEERKRKPRGNGGSLPDAPGSSSASGPPDSVPPSGANPSTQA